MRMMEKDAEQMEHRNLTGDEMMRMKCVTMDPNGDTRFLSFFFPLNFCLKKSAKEREREERREKEISKREKETVTKEK